MIIITLNILLTCSDPYQALHCGRFAYRNVN